MITLLCGVPANVSQAATRNSRRLRYIPRTCGPPDGWWRRVPSCCSLPTPVRGAVRRGSPNGNSPRTHRMAPQPTVGWWARRGPNLVARVALNDKWARKWPDPEVIGWLVLPGEAASAAVGGGNWRYSAFSFTTPFCYEIGHSLFIAVLPANLSVRIVFWSKEFAVRWRACPDRLWSLCLTEIFLLKWCLFVDLFMLKN
jgi:hypothetical protein